MFKGWRAVRHCTDIVSALSRYRQTVRRSTEIQYNFFPQKKLLINGIMCIYVVAILHLDTDVHTFFPLFLVTEAPLRCRVVVVVQLKN